MNRILLSLRIHQAIQRPCSRHGGRGFDAAGHSPSYEHVRREGNPHSFSNRGSGFRAGFWSLVLGVFLFGYMSLAQEIAAPLSPSPASKPFSFDAHEVITASGNRQTVLTGFLLGGAMAEILVVQVEENGNRRLRIYAFGNDTWERKLEATLRPETRFVDVLHLGGRDRLVTHGDGRLSWFDLETAEERELLAAPSNFNPPRRDEIPHVDISRDLNGDGRDDLVVPDVDGFWVFIQVEGGAFADPVKLGPAANLSGIYGADGYRYDPWSQSRIHEVDFNRDGRGDLVFWDENHFEIHIQDERGLFSRVAKTFTTEVRFDSDDPFFLAAGNMTGRVLHSLTDINGDGVADLTIVSLEGRGISQKRSAYEVHLGVPTTDGGALFARRADFTFQSDGKIYLGMERRDFNGDGQPDLMLTAIDLTYLKSSLWKRIKGFMGDDIWLDLEFYRGGKDRFTETPDAVRKIALDGVPSHREPGFVPLDILLRGATHERRRTQKSWPRAFNSTLLLGDVTGDGLTDLLIGHHPRQLEVFVGLAGPDLFSRRPQRVAIAVANDEEYAWLADLNQDGRQDILMHHPFTSRDAHGAPKRPPGTEPHRVTLLIAR